jgi:hypothetical protein
MVLDENGQLCDGRAHVEARLFPLAAREHLLQAIDCVPHVHGRASFLDDCRTDHGLSPHRAAPHRADAGGVRLPWRRLGGHAGGFLRDVPRDPARSLTAASGEPNGGLHGPSGPSLERQPPRRLHDGDTVRRAEPSWSSVPGASHSRSASVPPAWRALDGPQDARGPQAGDGGRHEVRALFAHRARAARDAPGGRRTHPWVVGRKSCLGASCILVVPPFPKAPSTAAATTCCRSDSIAERAPELQIEP